MNKLYNNLDRTYEKRYECALVNYEKYGRTHAKKLARDFMEGLIEMRRKDKLELIRYDISSMKKEYQHKKKTVHLEDFPTEMNFRKNQADWDGKPGNF